MSLVFVVKFNKFHKNPGLRQNKCKTLKKNSNKGNEPE